MQGVWQYYAFNVSQEDYQVVVNVDEATGGSTNCEPQSLMLHISLSHESVPSFVAVILHLLHAWVAQDRCSNNVIAHV